MDRSKWEYKKLGEVCTVVSGSTPKTQIEEYWNGSHFWITPAELDGSTYVSKSDRFLTDLAIEKTNLTLMPAGTVLLSSRAPIGKVAITTVPMYCNQGFKNLICSPAVHNKYLYWFLKGKTDYLNSLGRGATFKEISKTIVENIKIPVYSIEAQQSISDEIDCLNEMIAVKQEQLKEFDKLAQSIFYDMFGNPKYGERSLSEIGDIVTGSTPSTKTPENYSSDDVCFFKPSDLYDDSVNKLKQSEYYISSKAFNSCRKLPAGSVLVCCIGSIGKLAITGIESTCNQQINAIIPKKNMDPTFIAYAMMEKKSELVEIANAPVVPIINKSNFSKIKIVVPPLSLQQQFADKISAIEAQKELVKQSIAETQHLLDYTMDKYFG